MNVKIWLRILISLVGALAVAALIWFAAPLVPFGEAYPFEELWLRIVAMCVVFALIGGGGAYRLHRRREGAERIAREMGVDDSDAPVLADRMKDALGVLRNVRGGRANYLYDLPWYVLIGPPGSGKTTALVNSGLEFPLAKGAPPAAVAGIGGTRYCDWWFTEDAVLIDTAGRYTTQDSDAKADQKSWLAFLDLLKRNRPRQPINGVLVAISLEDLLTLSPEEIAAHAAAIRARLIELHERLKVDFPVYALFTKADLVIGFMEFFGPLDETGRAQVWGATFQTMDKTKSMLAEVSGEFAALVERLNEWVPARLGEEKDAASRVLLFGFPAQVAALQVQITTFLNKIFDPAHYKINAALRGFYLTSGTQQGTPIDQLLGALAKGFGAEAVGAPAYSGQGKSFFLTDLIKEVVIGEAGWVSTGRNNRMIRIAAFAALLFLTPLALGALWVAYFHNSEEIGESEEAAAKYRAVASGLGRSDVVADHDLSKVLQELHELRFLPDGYAAHEAAQNLPVGLGLNQSERLKSAAETAYGVGLERLMRPRLVYRLEEQLESDVGDPAQLFDALKVYLMLGGLETADRQFLVDWMERDWTERLYPGPKNSEGRKALEQHLVAMLDLENGHGSFVSLNGPLVEKTQAILARISAPERAYQLLATRAKATLRDDWSASKAGGAGAQIIFDDSLNKIEVPYFLTKAGFESAFMAKLPAVEEEMARDRWVLGPAGEQPAISAQYDHLQEELVDFYVNAFVSAWRDAIGKLKLRRLTAQRPAYPLLAAAGSVTSPFIRILDSIKQETDLGELEQPSASADASDAPGSAPILGASGRTPAQMIDAALAPYHHAVDGEPGRRPIDAVVAQLTDVGGNLSRYASSGAPEQQLASKLAGEIAKLKSLSATLPQPFARMMEKTAEDVSHEMGDASVAKTADELRSTITFACQDKIESRYPFARNAEQDVALEDFARMFGPKGLIDQFVSERVLPAVDTSGPQWKWRDDRGLAKKLGAAALAEFQRAAEIRDAFFAAGSAAPGFTYAVTPPAVKGARLEIDDEVIAGRSRSADKEQWPGSSETHRVSLSLQGSRAPAIERSGPWAIYRLLDAGDSNKDGTFVTFSLAGRELSYRFSSSPASPGAGLKPLDLTQLRKFHCPNGA